MSSTWKNVWVLWLCGVIAAAAFGKFGPLLTGLAHDRGFSLPAAGWLSSMIELGGATGGLLAGGLVRRLGSRGAIQGGLLLLVLGSAAECLPAAPGLWLGRVGESLGYLLVVVATPSLMMQLTTHEERPHAMSLWSTFVPVGLALGSVLSGLLAPAIGLSGTLLGWAIVPAVAILLTFTLPRTVTVAADQTTPARLPGLPVWWLCAAFFCCALLFVGVVGLLPTFLQTGAHLSLAASGGVTGAAAFATVAGSALTSWRLRRDQSRFSPGAIRDLDLLGLAVPALLLGWMYLSAPNLFLTALLAITALGLSGVVPALLFARISDAGHREDGAHPAVINGILTHFGATGSLLGPPTLAFLSLHAGWPAAAAFVVVLSIGVFGFATLAQRTPMHSAR